MEKEPLVFKVSPEETRLLRTGHPLSFPYQSIGQIHARPETGSPAGELLFTYIIKVEEYGVGPPKTYGSFIVSTIYVPYL